MTVGAGSPRAPGLRAAALAFCALAAACTVGPDYRAAEPASLDMPAAWRSNLPAPNPPEDASAWWWVTFQDSPLVTLVHDAELSSPTLAIVAGRLREARALLAATESAYFPSLSVTGSATKSNNVGNVPLPGAVGNYEARLAQSDARLSLDLFGRTRRSVEASQARLEAIEADLQGAYVSLVADIANAYAARRHCEAYAEDTRVSLASRAETHALIAQRVKAGFNPPVDAMRTEASLADARSLARRLADTCEKTVNALVALTGLSHGKVEERLATRIGRVPVVNPQLEPPRLPAELLMRRGDLRAAERAVAAASADIGVAIADRLPSVSLSGSVGVARTAVGDLSRAGSVWSVTPALNLPLLDGGLGAARVESARARYDQALAQYRLTARLAVQEVEDALGSIEAGRERLTLALLSAERSRAYFAGQEAAFRVGNLNLIDLEDARTLLVASDQALVNARLDLAQAVIALFRASGGGWPLGPTPSPAAQPPIATRP